jgi:hypothetical protein
MKQRIEKLITRFWNRMATRRLRPHAGSGLELGVRCSEDGATNRRVTISQDRRAQHVAVLGRTGQGKSRLIWNLAKQDIRSGRGFAYPDMHGDAIPFLLSSIAAQEKLVHEDLSERSILIDPADPEYSVGLNPLEEQSPNERFVQIAEFSQVLRQRWHLESFGARTDELLRNSLYALAESGLTLLELAPLLTHPAFRAGCLKKVRNVEVQQYFELRFDKASEPMQATMREPILNKVTAFTADPHFRHIIGQQRSTFSVLEAMDRGYWVILNLHKGRLGEQAATLGSLFLTTIKNALFSRKGRNLFTLFCDEIQNLVAYGTGLETVLSEARKFGVSVISANQFLDQYPAEMRAAIFAIGTHVFFQLSSSDAHQISTALDGGKPLAELLKNLPRRHMVVKSGHERWQEVLVPPVDEVKVDAADFHNRCRARWARKRADIEAEIQKRQAAIRRSTKEAFDDWE